MKKAVIGFMAVLLSSAAMAQPAPKLSVRTIDALPIVTATPYDASVDGRAVDAALARAKASGKLVLIDLGANWCPDCRILANVMLLPELKAFLAAHFEVVVLDVGRFDRNLEVAARFGIKDRLKGIPAVFVVSKEGKLLNPDGLYALSDARQMNPQAIADWLAGWVK